MADQTDLNCLLIDNLADLEAAGHQVDDELTPMITEAAAAMVGDAVEAAGWDGEADDLSSLWFAPKGWHEPGAGVRDYLCRFEYRPGENDEGDWFALSALLGVGTLSAGFYFDRHYGGGTVAWSKLLAAHKVPGKLEQIGFAYDRDDHTYYIPIRLEPEALKAGLREGALAAALAPFARAVEVARAAEPLLKPLVDAMSDQAMS